MGGVNVFYIEDKIIFKWLVIALLARWRHYMQSSAQMSVSIATLFFYMVLWVIINRYIEIFSNHSSMCSPRVTVCISNCVVHNIVWALVSDWSLCTSDECIAVFSRSWHVLFCVRFTIVRSRTMSACYVTRPLNIGVLQLASQISLHPVLIYSLITRAARCTLFYVADTIIVLSTTHDFLCGPVICLLHRLIWPTHTKSTQYVHTSCCCEQHMNVLTDMLLLQSYAMWLSNDYVICGITPHC